MSFGDKVIISIHWIVHLLR